MQVLLATPQAEKAALTHPVILQTQPEDWIEAVHVLGEGLAACISERTNGQHGLLMHTASMTLEDTQQSLHDRICLFQQACFGGVTLAELLNHNLQYATQQALHSNTAK